MMHVTKQFQHMKIQLEAIISATNNFSNDNCIGNGGFGKVYKGELIHSNGQAMVAIKRLNRAFGQGDPEFWKEIITLSRYKHENIVSLLGFCDESGEKILVYEYAPRRSLDLYLNSSDLTWIQRLKICIGAANGLAYLHNPGGTHQRVLHRDIKSSNILLDENWNARISDLGLSKFGPANQQITFLVSNAVGTIGYCDPVYIETGVLKKESDVYSFGVMLFEVLCGRLCIGNYNHDKHRPLTELARQCYEENKVNEIIYRNIKDEIKPKSLKAFTAIAYQCLKRDLEERPLMSEVVRILERALEHQRADENSQADYDSDAEEKIVESDLSTLDGGTSRNYVKEKSSTVNMRLKELREKEIILNENASLSAQVKKLNRDVAKLENFRKTLMMSFQDEEANFLEIFRKTLRISLQDEGNSAKDPPHVVASTVQDQASLSSQSTSGGSRKRVDGREFFRQARARLSYEQFGAFLANIKELNSHKQTKEETLQKTNDIFGPENKDLYVIFKALLSGKAR